MYPTTYRKRCFAAYGESCWVCESIREVYAHHINGRYTPPSGVPTEIRDITENTVPVCGSCHNKVHGRPHPDDEKIDLLQRVLETPTTTYPEEIIRTMSEKATATVTFKISESARDVIDEEAEERGLSRSAYIREIVHSRHEDEELRDEIEDLKHKHDREIETLEERHAKGIRRLERRIEENLEQEYAEEIEQRDEEIKKLSAHLHRTREQHQSLLDALGDQSKANRYAQEQKNRDPEQDEAIAVTPQGVADIDTEDDADPPSRWQRLKQLVAGQ